jgi:RHS repeat-associated protein
MRDGMGLSSYGYDKLYRLTSVDYPAAPDQTYTYDAAGNRLTLTPTGQPEQTYSYAVTNALTSMESGTTKYEYTYDAAGNLGIRKRLVGGQVEDTATYTFDGANRLRQVSSSASLLTYDYDADGHRVRETANGVVTWFVFDGLSVVMEMDGNKKPTSVLVPGVSRTRVDIPIPVTEWFLHDGLGSVIQLTDLLGNPTQMYQYDVFGATRNVRRDPFNRYRFVGLAADDYTGLTYMNARWYDPLTGRLLSRDPLRGTLVDPLTMNLYAYSGDNPTTNADPSGLASSQGPPSPNPTSPHEPSEGEQREQAETARHAEGDPRTAEQKKAEDDAAAARRDYDENGDPSEKRMRKEAVELEQAAQKVYDDCIAREAGRVAKNEVIPSVVRVAAHAASALATGPAAPVAEAVEAGVAVGVAVRSVKAAGEMLSTCKCEKDEYTRTHTRTR